MNKPVNPKTTPVYVDISSKVHKVHVDNKTNRAYFVYNDVNVWYDPQRDGRLIEQKEAIDKYPEQFV